jgi:aldose 1-epimerase
MPRDGDGDLVVPFAAYEPRPAMRGALLAPWPNRTADGRYRFRGVEHRLPVDERMLSTALAIEPMSCPPDALNSGRDLVVLQPGGSFETARFIRRLGR